MIKMRQPTGKTPKPAWRSRLWWLEPGLGVKRWLLLLMFGITVFIFGGAMLLRALYPLPAFFYYATLQFLPRPVRIVGLLLLGIGSCLVGLWGLSRALLRPFPKEARLRYPELLHDYQRRRRGPRVVVLGGGHGQATILRGLKAYTSNITAIVTVADNGGSSGRLRQELGILPPGDFRNCIAALANDESLLARLLQYRFTSDAGLDGHNFGNLYISAMAGVTGSFEMALEASSQVLAVQGKVLPSTLEAVTLCADVQVGAHTPVRIRGESEIAAAKGHILRVLLDPEAPRAHPKAVRAILDAELLIIGPGSLYTSILPNLLVPEIAMALRASRALKVYVCNVATQRGETDGYTAEDHLRALEKHLGPGLFSKVVVNLPPPGSFPPAGASWVEPELRPRPHLDVIQGELTSATTPWQHDSEKLAEIIMQLLP